MPYKNYADKLRWNALHNPNRVNSRQGNGNYKNPLRISLNGIKTRTYVCELCGLIGNTEFHEYNGNPFDLIEVCCGKDSCHEKCHDGTFDESVIDN